VTLRAHAKVNLRLRVLGRDAHGYHSIETLFLRIELADRLEVAPRSSPGITLDLTLDPSLGDDGVPDDESNLAWRAAERLLEEVGRGGGATIHLEKRIPSGSGLGGASSDAAAVLTALNGQLDWPLDADALQRIGGELGSDVPFFLLPHSMALGWERGRGLLPLRSPPSRPVLLVVPPQAIGSGEAYAWIDAHREGREPPAASTLPAAHHLSEWDALTPLAVNDFEAVVFERYPRLVEWKSVLVAAGAEVALLSGSGSTLFGVFATVEQRERAAGQLSADPEARVVRTATLDASVKSAASG
jgi:4-diphosphocytidyl-2-C-methyl-D-erythritol kinase